MSREPFIWNEIEHWTLADLMETLYLIESDEDAESFFTEFSGAISGNGKFNAEGDEIATHNIRYILDIISRDDEEDGDGGQEEAERIAELFQVDLPSESEVLSPLQTFGNSSCGLKVGKKTEPTEDDLTEDEFNAAVEAVEAGALP